MNYHHKQIPTQTCQTATYSLVGLLTLAIVVASCTKPSNSHIGSPLPTPHNKGINTVRPIKLDEAFIQKTMNRFGHLEGECSYTTYIHGFGTCYGEYISKGDSKQEEGITLAVFTTFAARCRHHTYLKKVFEDFMPNNMFGHSDCKKDPRFFVICAYVKCIDSIQKALNNAQTSKNQKQEQINQAITTFKSETQQVYPGTCGKKLFHLNGVCFKDADNKKGYTLSNHFARELTRMYTDLDKKLTKTQQGLENYIPAGQVR